MINELRKRTAWEFQVKNGSFNKLSTVNKICFSKSQNPNPLKIDGLNIKMLF